MSRVLIGVTASNTFYGRAIRKLTESEFNHAILLYESELWGGWWVVQVDNKGVRKVPAYKISSQWAEIQCFEYAYNLDSGLQKTKDYIGRKYDSIGILGFLLKCLIWRVFHKKILNPLEDAAKLFCSEYVMNVLKASKIPGAEFYSPASTSPGVLHEFLSRSEVFREVSTPIFEK